MDTHRPLARWEGFCAPCATERPLVLVAYGRHGVRAWLAGVGPEDRALSYCCLVCGRLEQVPATEELDAEYDATLLRWPDHVVVAASVPVPGILPLVALVPQPRRALVQVVTGSRPTVTATDGRLLSLVA